MAFKNYCCLECICLVQSPLYFPILSLFYPFLPLYYPILHYITLYYHILPYITHLFTFLTLSYATRSSKNYVNAGVVFAVDRFSCWILLYKLIVSFSLKDICNIISENGQQHIWPVFLHYTCINFAIAVSDHKNNNF